MIANLDYLVAIENKDLQNWVLDVAATIENQTHQGLKATQAWRLFQDDSSKDRWNETMKDHMNVMFFFKSILNGN